MCKKTNAIQYPVPLTSTPEEIEAFYVRLKHVLDEEAAIREAELREQEAREEGRKEGIEEGKIIGRKKGRQAIKEIVTGRLLAKRMAIKEISELTDLDEKHILDIQRQMEN